MSDKRKPAFTVSIYVPEEKFQLPKEIKKIAKKDKRFPKELREKKSSMLSYVTVFLWEKYKQGFEQLKNKESEESGETNDVTSNEEGESSNQTTDSS